MAVADDGFVFVKRPGLPTNHGKAKPVIIMVQRAGVTFVFDNNTKKHFAVTKENSTPDRTVIKPVILSEMIEEALS